MNTLKPYQKRIMINILNHMNLEPTDINIIKKKADIYKHITEYGYATTTARDYLITFSIILKTLKQFQSSQFVYDKAKEYNEEHLYKELQQELDPNELKNYVIYDDLINKVKELLKIYNDAPNYKNIINLLVLSLYVLHPPLRNDYNDMKILRNGMKEDRKYNYLLIDGPRYYIIINKDKVISSHGRAEISILDPLLKNILNVYFELYAQDNIYLFQDKNGLPYTKRQIQYIINKYFKNKNKVLNIYNLRSAYISAFYKSNLDIQSRNILADNMRHSRQTAELIYCKFF